MYHSVNSSAIQIFFCHWINYFGYGISFNMDVFGQMEQTSNNFDKAKSSSDEAISLIDSLKGSSLLDSVVEGMQNFSFPIANQSNNNDNDTEISQTLDNALNYLGPNNTTSNITTVSPDKNNITISDNNNNLTNDDNY